ncbi:hypothetical protein FQA39_LY00696 [Lamprigera yunnana]|nr:hypothetical protein FQA39_LY00696 [Lamprigera yunnana]
MFGHLRNILSIMKRGFTVRRLTNMEDNSNSRIVWMDMEMTGLDIEKDQIMEVACMVTDSNLNIVAEGPNIILHTSEDVLCNMSEWCIKQHKKTGLTDLSQKSNVTIEDAEKELFTFISSHTLERCCPLAGNSVYMDRLFLRKFMPKVNGYLHYRIIDVSTIKELCRMWNKDIYKSNPQKSFEHRALGDIKESIAELQFYKNNFFNVKF